MIQKLPTSHLSNFSESRERKKKNSADNDYYSDSDDEFLDRTGDVQRKRLKRMKAASKSDEVNTETYDSLVRGTFVRIPF